MNCTVKIADDYEPQVGDVVLVLEEEGALYQVRLMKPPADPESCWLAEPMTGKPVVIHVHEDELLGQVVA
jgi:hypothetical protein